MKRFVNKREKVFEISGELEKDGKLICEIITAFDEMPKKLWLKFATKEEFMAVEQRIMDILRTSEGGDQVAFYIENPKAMKTLPPNHNIKADALILQKLSELLGEENVRLV